MYGTANLYKEKPPGSRPGGLRFAWLSQLISSSFEKVFPPAEP